MTKLSEETKCHVISAIIDTGKIIESGYMALCIAAYPDAPEIQIQEMRNAFFAGARLALDAIIAIVNDQASGATSHERSVEKIKKIDGELREFLSEFKRGRGLFNGEDEAGNA